MSLAGNMECSQFRHLVQRGLDGFDDALLLKQIFMAHREACAPCQWFHNQLSQLFSVAPYVPAPDEFLPEQPKILASRVMEALDLPGQADKLFHFDDTAMEEIFRLNLGLKEAQKVYHSRNASSLSASGAAGLEAFDSGTDGDTVMVLSGAAGSPQQLSAGSSKEEQEAFPPPPKAPATPAKLSVPGTAARKAPLPEPAAPADALPPAHTVTPVTPAAIHSTSSHPFPASTIPPPPAAVAATPAAPATLSQPVAQRSAPGEPAPMVKGIGRIDNSKIEAESDVPNGRITAIGKFLLDAQDVPLIDDMVNRIENAQNIRLVTVDAAATIYKLQEYLAGQPGVSGTILLGHDGSIISAKLKQGMDVDAVAVWSLCSYLNSANASRLLGHNRLQQVVSKTEQGFVVIIDFGEGLLITLIDAQEPGLLVNLMRKITGLIH